MESRDTPEAHSPGRSIRPVSTGHRATRGYVLCHPRASRSLRTVAYVSTGLRVRVSPSQLRHVIFDPRPRKYLGPDKIGSRPYIESDARYVDPIPVPGIA
eukprot:9195-Rhodomonas_salina.3